MAITKDQELLRELAKQYRELAEQDVNRERRDRLRAVNDLHTGLRPGVWLDELPWHELDADGSLTLRCEDSFARQMEQFFRRALFRWKHFQADMVLEAYYPVYKSYTDDGNGLEVEEEIQTTDAENPIVSHAFRDVLDTEEKLSRMHPATLTAYPDQDRANVARAQELLGDTLPVRLCGTQIYCAPWDDISRLRGVEAILFDMVDRPEFLHQIMAAYRDNWMGILTQMEDLGLLDNQLPAIHCTPAYTSDLPPAPAGEKTPLKQVWFRGMAHIFSTVSPAMHQECDLDYLRPLMDRCGLVYYGCCEPLDNKIGILKKIPNLRKVGASPWADVERCAEQLGSGYVLARKPNPALVSGSFDREAVARETEETIQACLRHNCPYEFVLKDISTVSYKLENLVEWNKTVQATIDKYYR